MKANGINEEVVLGSQVAEKIIAKLSASSVTLDKAHSIVLIQNILKGLGLSHGIDGELVEQLVNVCMRGEELNLSELRAILYYSLPQGLYTCIVSYVIT